jgi:predicted dehydrogenase
VLETEDTAAAVMQWESGMIATLEASTAAAPGFDEGYEVHSTTASARIEKGKMTYLYHQEGLPAPEPGLQPCPSGLDDKLCLFYRQYLDVLNAIQSDVLDNSSALDAVAVVETVERIYRSANEGTSFEPAH